MQREGPSWGTLERLLCQGFVTDRLRTWVLEGRATPGSSWKPESLVTLLIKTRNRIITEFLLREREGAEHIWLAYSLLDLCFSPRLAQTIPSGTLSVHFGLSLNVLIFAFCFGVCWVQAPNFWESAVAVQSSTNRGKKWRAVAPISTLWVVQGLQTFRCSGRTRYPTAFHLFVGFLISFTTPTSLSFSLSYLHYFPEIISHEDCVLFHISVSTF